jgi:hypothetical protein
MRQTKSFGKIISLLISYNIGVIVYASYPFLVDRFYLSYKDFYHIVCNIAINSILLVYGLMIFLLVFKLTKDASARNHKINKYDIFQSVVMVISIFFYFMQCQMFYGYLLFVKNIWF